MITVFFLSLAVIFLNIQNYFILKNLDEVRHDLNDLTCRFIRFKVMTESKNTNILKGDENEEI